MKRWLAVALSILLVAVGGLFYIKGQSRIGQTVQGSLLFGFYDVGLRLSGTEVTTPMTDFSWTDTIRWVQIETTPWYRIPYHITTDFARDIDTQALYTHSSYRGPAATTGTRDIREDFGSARGWNRNVMRDPRIRFRMWGDDRVFRAMAQVVTDPAEYERARQAFHNKMHSGLGLCPPEGTDPPPCGLEKQKPETRSRTYYFRIVPQFSGN
jgi:hypothetical protein